jgi:hypothetical protein
MMPRRLFRGLLMPNLTVGQQNRIVLLLSERSALSAANIGGCFSDADRHGANVLSRYATDESLETRAGILARGSGLSLATAAILIGMSVGLRLGIEWGRSNVVRARHLQNMRRREREAEPPPPFDPVKAKAEYDAAVRWAKKAGRMARSGGRS